MSILSTSFISSINNYNSIAPLMIKDLIENVGRTSMAYYSSGKETKKYDTIFLGFPIWWYIAPTIVNTFLEKYDFSNKKIILFATSGGSGFGETVKYLRPSVADSCDIQEGKLLRSSFSVEELKTWAENL